uniref:hypothetical protein n=1 Tax=Planotetraspora phitsanulokensis TaxID=575192 RepID=UPI00195211FB|nr:hypothetical protein [Planotetraspora phitsanulokensis]
MEGPAAPVIARLVGPAAAIVTIPGTVSPAEPALTWRTRAEPFPATLAVAAETAAAFAIVARRSGASVVGTERAASAVVTVSESTAGLGRSTITIGARAVSPAVSATVIGTVGPVAEAATLTRGPTAVTSAGATIVAVTVAVATARGVTVTVGGPRAVAGAEAVTVTV